MPKTTKIFEIENFLTRSIIIVFSFYILANEDFDRILFEREKSPILEPLSHLPTSRLYTTDFMCSFCDIHMEPSTVQYPPEGHSSNYWLHPIELDFDVPIRAFAL